MSKTIKSINRVSLPMSKAKQLRFGKPGGGKHAAGHAKPKERNQRG